MKKKLLVVLICFFSISCKTFYSKQDIHNDASFLIEAIEKNYPYLQVHKRVNGYDWRKYVDYKLTEDYEIGTKEELFKYFQGYFNGLNGHADVISSELFPMYYITYTKMVGDYPGLKKLVTILEDPRVLNAYSYKQTNQSTSLKPLVIKKHTDEKLVYLNIPSFNHLYIEMAKVEIEEYLSTHANKDKVIVFDISENDGGSDLFWKEIIVKPLIKKPVNYTKYTLYKGGDLSLPYITDNVDKLYDIQDIDIKLNPEKDVENYKYFSKNTINVEPNKNGLEYKKIIVVMSKRNFSASENFVDFCKKTSFATLIGQRSGGDGNFLDPLLVKLPYTNLLFRIPVSAELNNENRLNYEFGTEPDIYINENINAMDFINENLMQIVLTKSSSR